MQNEKNKIMRIKKISINNFSKDVGISGYLFKIEVVEKSSLWKVERKGATIGITPSKKFAIKEKWEI